MSRIRPEEVREIATLARLDLSDQEIQRMTTDLDAILGYVAALKDLDTSAVEPMTHAVPFDCPVRPDQVGTSLPVDEALQNAPRREESFFQVPRIIVSLADGVSSADGLPPSAGGPSEEGS